MSNIIHYHDLKEKLTKEKIMKVACESKELVIQELVTQLLTMTKLLHSEEVKVQVDSMLRSYGFDEQDLRHTNG